MVYENQQIIYRKNGKEISRLSTAEYIPVVMAVYVRTIQPFVSEGTRLTIPVEDERRLYTSVIKKVDRRGNTLVVQTQNSTYEIEYYNIDLEQILKVGKDNGINRAEGVSLHPFPCLTKKA